MPDESLTYQLSTIVTAIHASRKIGETSTGVIVPYDILVLATGSTATLPRITPGIDAKVLFLYRTIKDLQKLI